jgi:O-phospho-L-seryl-tRNASec:L-selenocysteinyl-tRNA synthase
MDAKNVEFARSLIGNTYADQGGASLRRREGLVRILLTQRCLPEIGWDDATIESFLADCAAMDSNNFLDSVGAGEREARVFSSLVKRRNMGFGHGIGRSGDVATVQPKAGGSSLVYKLTNRLALHATRICGITKTEGCLVLPLATGMSISLVLQTIKTGMRKEGAKYIVWPRMDQKSCFKAILTSGCVPVVVEMKKVGDELCTDTEAIESEIERLGAENIVAVVSTTSCFAPRAPDDVVSISRLCASKSVPHVINHAYGLQLSKSCHELNEACRVGRVDAWVASTDKNFMVPVGGAIVGSPSESIVDAVSKLYPGRASISPVLDLFITLVSMGTNGLKRLLQQRKEVFTQLKEGIEKVAVENNERVLSSPHNAISIGMTVDTISYDDPSMITYLGSMLFARGVSGTRIVNKNEAKSIEGYRFRGYGSQCNEYPHAYLTAAAAIGMTSDDVTTYIDRLKRCIIEFKKQKHSGGAKGSPNGGLGGSRSSGEGSRSDTPSSPFSSQTASI